MACSKYGQHFLFLAERLDSHGTGGAPMKNHCKKIQTAFCITFLSLLFPTCVYAQTDAIQKARLGRVMWSAFQCSTFAEMSENKKEQGRLFKVGYKAGRQFLEAVKNWSAARIIETPG
jgi:hypothetical protein